MSEAIVQEFDIQVVAGDRKLWVQSDRIEACLARYREGDLDSIGVSDARGFEPTHLPALAEHRDILHLTASFLRIDSASLSALYRMSQLKTLILADAVAIDLGRFPELSEFRGKWHPGMSFAGSLEVLGLYEYAPSSKDLRGIAELTGLSELELIGGKLDSLGGIESLSLVKLQLTNIRSLASIVDIGGVQSLRELRFDGCKRICDFEALTKLERLEVLWLNNCGSVKSVSFAQQLESLREIRFVGTRVEDGDLAALVGVTVVAFSPQRNYSHSLEALQRGRRPKREL